MGDDLLARVRAKARRSPDPLWGEVAEALEACDVVTVSEAAGLLGCSVMTVHRRIAAGELRVVEHERTAGQGRYLIRRAEVKRLVSQS